MPKEIKEHEIRPPDLKGEANRLAQQDAERLLTQKGDFVSIGCPACGSNDCVPAFAKGGFDFLECSQCGTLYVSPRPTAEMLGTYYSTAESFKFRSRRLFPASELARKERIFRPRLERLVPFLEGKQVEILVDVGAGFGWFAEMCSEQALARRVIAVEPSPELAESCRRSSGVEVIEIPIEECCQFLQVDVITSFELIEHLFEPREFLQACFEGLKPNGLLLLTTPNWYGLDLQVLRERSSNVRGPNHLNYFNPRSLNGLLSQVGFVEVEITTPGELDVDILYNQISAGLLNPEEIPGLGRFIKDSAIDARRDLQLFLQRHKLSSHMMAVCRKPA